MTYMSIKPHLTTLHLGHFVRIAHSEVSVSHPNAVKQLLLASLQKGDWYKIQAVPDSRYATAISVTDPKEKIELSKNINPGLSHSNVLKSEVSIDQVVDKLFNWMDRYSETKEPMALDQFLTYTVLDSVGEIIFSKPYGFLDSGADVGGTIAMNKFHSKYLAIMGYYGWFHWLIANRFVAGAGFIPMGHLYDRTMGFLRDRQENKDAKFDVAAYWFRALEKAERENSPHFNLKRLQAAAAANVGAGGDTVACVLQAFVYYTIRHPDAWDHVRQEINTAQKEGRCNDGVISHRDASMLPYLQACINEAMRICPSVPWALPRIAPKGGITIGDRTFPEGVTLSISPWVIHHSKEIWGSDADSFNPERWLASDSKLDKYLIPFSLGYASCPGQHVARILLSKILATVVRDYDIRQVDPKKEWTLRAGFLLIPEDWPVYITKRVDS